MARIKKETSFEMNEELICSKALLYRENNQTKLDCEKRMKELRPDIEGYLNEKCSTDAKGNEYCVLQYQGKQIILRHNLRRSSVLRPEAIDILKKLKLDDCLETTTIVREDIVEAKIASGEIPEKYAEKLFALKTSKAFMVDVQDESHE